MCYVYDAIIIKINKISAKNCDWKSFLNKHSFVLWLADWREFHWIGFVSHNIFIHFSLLVFFFNSIDSLRIFTHIFTWRCRFRVMCLAAISVVAVTMIWQLCAFDGPFEMATADTYWIIFQHKTENPYTF